MAADESTGDAQSPLQSERRTLGDIVALQRGTTYKGDLVGEPGPVLLGLGSIEPGGGFRHSKYKTYGGDCPEKLLVRPGELYASLKGATKDGSMIGSVARVPPSFQAGRLTQDTVRLDFQLTDDFTRRHTYWALRTPQCRDYYGGCLRGTTSASISREDFLGYELPPVTDEARTIVDVLDAIERKIVLNEEMNQTLEEIARAVFKSWFIDFDPVHAKAQGEPTGLPPEVEGLFPSSFEETEEGMVPEGWAVKPLSTQVRVTRGLSYSGAGLSEPGEGVPMHNLNSIYEGGGYKASGLKWFTGEYKERHIARPGDALVANTEQGHDRLLIGYPAIVPDAWDGPMIFSHHLYKVDPKPKAALTREFIAYWLKARRSHDLVSGFANGTTVNMLPVDALQIPEVVLPPGGLVEAFSTMVQSCHAKMQNNEANAKTLSELRDTLLPRLVSGELQLPVEVPA